MRFRIFGLSALLLAVATVWGQEPPPTAGKLGRRVQSLVDRQIGPAYAEGGRLQLLDGLSSVTARMKPAQRQALDRYLQRSGMPPSGKMMVDCYLSLVTQGYVRSLPSPSLRDVMAMVPEMSNVIDEVLDEVDQSVVTLEPLPVLASMEDYEGLFWEMHVLKNRIEQAGNYARYGAQLLDRAQNSRTRVHEDDIETLVSGFGERVQQLQAAYDDLQQRQFDFRLDRMEVARMTLESSDDVMERMRAAFAGQLDARMFEYRSLGPEQASTDRSVVDTTTKRTTTKTTSTNFY